MIDNYIDNELKKARNKIMMGMIKPIIKNQYIKELESRRRWFHLA